VTIQGYIALTIADASKTAFSELFEKYAFKFNVLTIGGTVGERHSKRRAYWDLIPKGYAGHASDTWYYFECCSFYELEEMVRSGRVHLVNHGFAHLHHDKLYDNVLTRDTSLLTGTANSGQKVVAVADGSKFDVNDRVKIYDDAHFEWNRVDSKDGNNLTMLNNLQYTYTVTANGAVLETGLSEIDLLKEVLPVDDIVELAGQVDGCTSYVTPFGSYTDETWAILEQYFAHMIRFSYSPSNFLSARNSFPIPKELKLVFIGSDKSIADDPNWWDDIDDALNDARNNHVLQIFGVESIETYNLLDGSRSISPANFAIFATKIADFQAAGRIILLSELGTLS